MQIKSISEKSYLIWTYLQIIQMELIWVGALPQTSRAQSHDRQGKTGAGKDTAKPGAVSMKGFTSVGI